MELEQALRTLRDAAPTLRAKGVLHAAIFGSTARGEQRPDSDLDILVDFDPAARITIYDYVAIKDDIASLFEQPVDVVDRAGLKPHLRQPVARDLVYAF
jgi:predicted nucleotidyltransferase